MYEYCILSNWAGQPVGECLIVTSDLCWIDQFSRPKSFGISGQPTRMLDLPSPHRHARWYRHQTVPYSLVRLAVARYNEDTNVGSKRW